MSQEDSMTPEEALENWIAYSGANALPPIYREMGRERLRILVTEMAKPRPIPPMDRIPTMRLNYNPLDRMLGRETPPPAAAPAVEAPAVEKPTGVMARALCNPKRLRTPRRQRGSFLYHLEVCGSVAQAAARAGVNRGTLYRWRARIEGFAERWDKAIARRAREVGVDIVLQAGQPLVDPLFHDGKKVGERRRPNTQLLMHVQRRMDGERRRAEDRAERRELALLRAKPFDEAALAERLAALLQQRPEMSVPATPPATAETAEPANEAGEKKDAA